MASDQSIAAIVRRGHKIVNSWAGARSIGTPRDTRARIGGVDIRERALKLRSSQWPLILCGGTGLWLAAAAVTAVTGNPVLLPTDLLAGSFVVPVTVVVCIYESGANPTLTPRCLVAAFVGGGGLSMLVAALFENWLLPSGSIRFLGVGLIEELAKAAMLALVTAGRGVLDTRSGVVLGAAVGFGYAAFESSGYALDAFNGSVAPAGAGGGLGNMLWIEAERATLAPVLNGLWTAVLGGTMLRAASKLARARAGAGLIGVLLLVVGLHAGWDAMDSVAAFVAAAATLAGAHQAVAYWSADLAGSLAVCLVGTAAFVTVWRSAAGTHPSDEPGPRGTPAGHSPSTKMSVPTLSPDGIAGHVAGPCTVPWTASPQRGKPQSLLGSQPCAVARLCSGNRPGRVPAASGLARIRVPEVWYGDYLAAVGATRIGERRLVELVRRYCVGLVKHFVDAWLEYSERPMVHAIGRLPSGSFEGSGHHDPLPGISRRHPHSGPLDREAGRGNH